MEIKYRYYNRDGVKRTAIVDEEEPYKLKVYTEVEMDKVLESIKQDREAPRDRRSPNRLVARVPLTVVEQSIHEQWDDNDWKKWLNDPDNAHFRVWQGRV